MWQTNIILPHTLAKWYSFKYCLPFLKRMLCWRVIMSFTGNLCSGLSGVGSKRKLFWNVFLWTSWPTCVWDYEELAASFPSSLLETLWIISVLNNCHLDAQFSQQGARCDGTIVLFSVVVIKVSKLIWEYMSEEKQVFPSVVWTTDTTFLIGTYISKVWCYRKIYTGRNRREMSTVFILTCCMLRGRSLSGTYGPAPPTNSVIVEI